MLRRFGIAALCAACFGAGALPSQRAEIRASGAPGLRAYPPPDSGDAQTQTTGTRREPQFENDHVRVWKSIIMPRQPLALHRHEKGRALIALKGGQLKVVDKDGKAINTYNWETGKAYWLDADPPGQMHGDLNDTSEPIEVIVVELKR